PAARRPPGADPVAMRRFVCPNAACAHHVGKRHLSFSSATGYGGHGELPSAGSSGREPRFHAARSHIGRLPAKPQTINFGAEPAPFTWGQAIFFVCGAAPSRGTQPPL